MRIDKRGAESGASVMATDTAPRADRRMAQADTRARAEPREPTRPAGDSAHTEREARRRLPRGRAGGHTGARASACSAYWCPTRDPAFAAPADPSRGLGLCCSDRAGAAAGGAFGAGRRAAERSSAPSASARVRRRASRPTPARQRRNAQDWTLERPSRPFVTASCRTLELRERSASPTRST